MISPSRPKRGESGNSLFVGTLSLVFIIPLMGLAIDASFLYAAKARLQAAVDGAALGAARALNLGNTLVTQQTNAAQNAVNWFYANFPPGAWNTMGTVMGNGSVTENDGNGFYSQSVNIYPDASNPQLDHVDVIASTKVPTYFMKWFGVQSTTLNVLSKATRRAAVVMMVLDRSGSMCEFGGSNHQPCTKANSSYPCAQMIKAAKQFTGQFAEGRDYIGMLTFSTNTYIVVNSGGVNGVPDQNFQATLGYSNNFGSSNGAIDNITCEGGTGTAQAIAQGFSLLTQAGLPGALNILLIETDGLPNSLTLNFYDSGMTPGSNMTGLSATSNCTDTTIDVAHPSGYKTGQNGFQTAASIPSWNSFGLNLSAAPFGTAASPYPNTPLSMVGVVYSVDPPSTGFSLMMNQWSNPNGPQSTQSTVSIPAGGGYGAYDTNAPLPAGKAPGCLFHGGTITNSVSDFRWFPATDVYGSQLSPSLNPYKSVGAVDGRGHLTGVNWTNYHAGALNATDNAAYNARANTTYQPYIFTLGLGGNSAGAPPDHILMQRMANDPDADTFNSPALYTACSTEPGCVTYTGAGSGQLQGRYVYAPSSNQLAQAFLQISSQILRLSQ